MTGSTRSLWAMLLALVAGFAAPAMAQEILPFAPQPSGSVAGVTMQDSAYGPLPAVSHLPPDAPNILVVLTDAFDPNGGWEPLGNE